LFPVFSSKRFRVTFSSSSFFIDSFASAIDPLAVEVGGQWQNESKSGNARAAGFSSRPTVVTVGDRDIVPNPNAARPVKRQAKSVGSENPRTDAISVGRSM
jgi:hypothetical protein